MNVNFTGLQNIGAFRIIDCHNFNTVTGINDKLIVQLTNKGKRDLNEFADVFKKFPDKEKLGFLEFDLKETANLTEFKLNSKPLDFKNENMGILPKIFTLIKEINGNDEKKIISNNYLSSEYCANRYRDALSLSDAPSSEILDVIHNPEHTSRIAGDFFENLNKKLNEFLGITQEDLIKYG